MSFGISVEVGGATQGSSSYTVTHVDGCMYIVGSVPMVELGALVKTRPKQLMCNYLAKCYGASFFVGPKDKIAQLRKLWESKREDQFKRDVEQGKDAALAWLKYGDVGLSSEFMCKFLSGIAGAAPKPVAPGDYDDFQRCEKMLDWLPHLRSKIDDLAQFECYKVLVRHWDELSQMHRSFQSNKDKWPTKEQSRKFHELMGW